METEKIVDHMHRSGHATGGSLDESDMQHIKKELVY